MRFMQEDGVRERGGELVDVRGRGEKQSFPVLVVSSKEKVEFHVKGKVWYDIQALVLV